MAKRDPIEGEVDPETGELFDPGPYTLVLPSLNGRMARDLVFGFAGSVEVDKMLRDRIEHFDDVGFGDQVVMTIRGTVGAEQWSIKLDPETGEELVTLTKKIKVLGYATEVIHGG
jgi:hypothetical protein